MSDHVFTAVQLEAKAHERGLRMAEVSRKAGLHHSIFQRWKQGKYEPSLKNYRALVGAVFAPAQERTNRKGGRGIDAYRSRGDT